MSSLALSWTALPLPLADAKTPPMADFAPTTDEALVAASLAGDEAAFAELVSRHKRRVFAAAARFARDDHQLDDIAQEIFVRVFRHLGKFRGDAPFEHWLSRIIVSACYDFLRKERRVREQVSLDAAEWDMRDAGIDAAIAAGRARELVALGAGEAAAGGTAHHHPRGTGGAADEGNRGTHRLEREQCQSAGFPRPAEFEKNTGDDP